MLVGAENEWGTLLRRPFIKAPENGTMELSNSMANLYQEHLMKVLYKPQVINNNNGTFLSVMQQESAATRGPLQEMKSTLATENQKVHLSSTESMPLKNLHSQSLPNQQPNALNMHPLLKTDQPEKLHPHAKIDNHLPSGTVTTDKPKLESEVLPDHHMFDYPSMEGCNIEKAAAANPVSPQSLASQLTFHNHQTQNPLLTQSTCPWPMQSQLESSIISHPQLIDMAQSDPSIVNGMLPQLDIDEWMVYPSCQPNLQDHTSFQPQAMNPSIPSMNQEVWDHYVKNNLKVLPQGDQLTSSMCHQPGMYHGLNGISNSNNLRDLSAESNNQSEICVNVDVSNSVNTTTTTMVDPSTSSTILDEFCAVKDRDFQHPQDCMVGNLSSSQDGQSQITSASLAESRAFSLRDNSGGTSSSHVDFDESSFLQNNNSNSWQQVAAPIRTYTKVCSGKLKISLKFHSYYKV